MADLETIARPYAKAIFDLALQQNTMTDWSNILAALSLAAGDANMQKLFIDPRVSIHQLVDILISICSKDKNKQTINLLNTLAEQNRLSVLPEIAKLFEIYRAKREKIITVEITSALPLSKTIKNNLQQALKIRLQCNVDLAFEINSDLIGGAIIRAGDLVIDGSVRSKLLRMAHALSS